MTKGAIAGIVVGSVAGFALLLLLTIVVLRHSRHRPLPGAHSQTQEAPAPLVSQPDMSSATNMLQNHRAELHDTSRGEPMELPSPVQEVVTTVDYIADNSINKKSL